MKSFLLLLFVVVVVVSDQWSSFKFKFNKVYRTHEEESYHKSCFVRNLQLIAIKNSISNEVTYGITKFADLCSEDLKRLFPTIPVDGRRGKEASAYPRNEAIKAKTQPFDWRKKGAVTNVKDQGECGATWAFAAAENMEGQWYLASHGLYNLSAQELVSCDPNSQGCNGGYSDYAQKYAVANGITSADIYPYTSGTTMDSGICEPNKVKQPVARFRDMIYIPGDEDQMLTWTAQNGPLSVAIGSVTDFYFYTGGIITSCPPTGVDHCVNLVGYGILPNGTSYWIAKNMWGTDWGENGYFRMLYGQNTCNLTAIASSVQV